MADHLTKPLPRASLERARGHCLGSRRIKFPVEFSKFELNPPPSKSPDSGGFREGVIEAGGRWWQLANSHKRPIAPGV